jgi:hypothetical protein
VVGGHIAEGLPPGPGLAGWLAAAGPGELEDGALAGVAASFRRLASWAQAGELAAVAQIASRAAARDARIGVAEDGRPARVPRSACSEVALGLVMSEYGTAWWADLAVTLTWRLAATGAGQREGRIDLYRARLIAEQTAALDDAAARAVEEMVLPGAGGQTAGQLRAALRQAVIVADPRGRSGGGRRPSGGRGPVCTAMRITPPPWPGPVCRRRRRRRWPGSPRWPAP